MAAIAAASGCAASPVRSPADGLPTYGALDASLIDDSFSGHLFETAFVPGVAGDDPHFDESVLRAEQIWLLKVGTVSREGVAGRQRYQVSFRTLDSLVGPPPTRDVSLTISGRDRSFNWLDRMGGGWVGTEVLLLVRRYRRGDQVVLHFHGEPNSQELRARIGRIRQASQSGK